MIMSKKMNELIQVGDMIRLGDMELTKSEALIARGHILRKVNIGIVTRLRNDSVHRYQSDISEDGAKGLKLVSDLNTAYRGNQFDQGQLLEDMATALGISNERCEDIRKYIYENETRI